MKSCRLELSPFKIECFFLYEQVACISKISSVKGKLIPKNKKVYSCHFFQGYNEGCEERQQSFVACQ